MSDSWVFLRELLSRPKQVSAIAPSSRWLARAMAHDVGPATGQVVEFGPGTGRLTEAILATGVRPQDLSLFELSGDFVTHLRRKFPGVTVINEGAEKAGSLLPAKAGAVISGLPLLSMPLGVRESIVRAAFDVLRPDGIYVQFTYGPWPPVSAEQIGRLGLQVRQTAFVWANLPPARVFTFRRA